MKHNCIYQEGNCLNLNNCPSSCCGQYPPNSPPWFNQPYCPPACPPPNMCDCGCLNFQIPYSFIYLYVGYLIGNKK